MVGRCNGVLLGERLVLLKTFHKGRVVVFRSLFCLVLFKLLLAHEEVDLLSLVL